ncbi:MAG TPA: GatB/YqeY domain-containing protein [bacterium]|nr:GatB/YqeY domain-containing protein [bacterium]HPN36237.1 GatB/YqeY domain-containing protein [bacterium]
MSILERLTEDMKEAMKRGDKERLSTIRLLRGQIKDAEINKRAALSEEEELAVLTNAAKKRRESIEAFTNAQRDDLAAKEKSELEVIQTYLPSPLSNAEIETIVQQALVESGAQTIKDLGKVMQLVAPKTRGRADGKMVTDLVRNKLSL